jgi:hypothetical protein
MGIRIKTIEIDFDRIRKGYKNKGLRENTIRGLIILELF